MLVKVCGVTREDQAALLAELGVDAIGLNFVPASPRRVDIATARSLARLVKGRVLVVGVVADLDRVAAEALLHEAELDVLQLHGDEPPALVRALGGRVWKAIRVGAASDVEAARAYDGTLVVDARVEGVLGGTGREVDATLVAPLAKERRVILAGGLGPENVAARVRAIRPWGVDAASGVERAPGDKDLERVRAFVEAARAAAGE